MYLHRLTVLLTVAICLFLTSINASLEIVEDKRRFIYYYEYFDASHVAANTEMSSSELKRYALNAYKEMINYQRPPGFTKHDPPSMISALWVPDDQVVVISSSTRKGDGKPFAYDSESVPTRITELLRSAADSGKWATEFLKDKHKKGGSCAEIVALSSYFMEYPRKGLPSPTGAKILTVGNQASNNEGVVGGEAVLVKPCIGTVNEGGGCRDFLEKIGVRWCGPGSTTDSLEIRDGDSGNSETKFECHGANEPPDFSNPQATYASVVSNTSIYADTATAVVSIVDDEISFTITPSGFAVNTDGVTVSATSLGTEPTISSTSATPQESGAVDASTIIGDPDKESKYCVQECVAAFKSCISGSNTDQIGSVSAMDCHVAAACYCTTPPYESPESSTGSGSAPVNPQDPASDPELLSSRIDMAKVDGLCTKTCQSLEAGDAKKTASSTKTFGLEARDASDTSFNLTDSWKCIQEAQKPGASADAVCTIS